MTTGVRQDIIIQQGATFSQQFNLMDGGIPINLSGNAVRASIKWRYSDPSGLLEFTTGIGNLTGGQITLNLTNLQTSGLTSSKFLYEIETTSSSGVQKPIYGKADVYPSII